MKIQPNQPNRIERFLQRTADLLTETIQSQVDGWVSAHQAEPSSGPEQQVFRLKKMLKSNQQNFGKDSIYTLSTHVSLADHHKGQLQGIEAATHYNKALEIFEKELAERGEVESLHKLIPACLVEGKDAASLYEKAADFFQLYGGSEKSLPLLERARQLLPKQAGFERRAEIQQKIARVHADSGNSQQASRVYDEIWSEALQTYPPLSPELASHAENLARSLGQGKRSEELWGLSLSLQGANRSSPALSVLSRQYSALGYHDQAHELRNQSEILSLEERVRSAPVTPLLQRDLKRLIELYDSKGDQGSLERARLKLTVVETRLALKGPLTW
ncbi:hypothetical protein JST97_29605 [bacterium]|nr:hypothetical protein [bacterium]